ncbi:MAG: hypothetical protein ABI389_05310 [Rhodanobacter sp.]
MLAVFSARILRMASALLLPPERVEHYLANPASDTLAEPQIDLRQPLPSD